MSKHAGYLTRVFNLKEQDKAVRAIRKIIREEKIDFDGFVVTGVSGIAMGSVLARSCKKKLVVVRKSGENTHSGYENVENLNYNDTLIFLDDLMASGGTYRRVLDTIEKHMGSRSWKASQKPKIVGGMFYSFYWRFSSGIGFIPGDELSRKP